MDLIREFLRRDRGADLKVNSETAAGPIELKIDVTDAVTLSEGPTYISGWLFLPPDRREDDLLTLVICVPGGSYTKAYYHQVLPGRFDYSFATWLANKGLLVLALDHLGVGDRSRPADGAQVTVELMATAHHAAVLAIKDQLSRGTLTSSLGPLQIPFIVGVGHSLGGCVTLVQEATHKTYGAIGIFGYPCQRNPDVYDYDRRCWIAQAEQPSRNGYARPSRSAFRTFFHFPDVPEDVLAIDDATITSVPDGIHSLAYPGGAAEYAAEIDVPVFLGWGEIDASPAHGEPAFYKQSNDVTLFLLPGSGHCHNSASTRHLLWERLSAWIETVSKTHKLDLGSRGSG
jgi:pimeloyl-ACP methyl ester carboxylesterase